MRQIADVLLGLLERIYRCCAIRLTVARYTRTDPVHRLSAGRRVLAEQVIERTVLHHDYHHALHRRNGRAQRAAATVSDLRAGLQAAASAGDCREQREDECEEH